MLPHLLGLLRSPHAGGRHRTDPALSWNPAAGVTLTQPHALASPFNTGKATVLGAQATGQGASARDTSSAWGLSVPLPHVPGSFLDLRSECYIPNVQLVNVVPNTLEVLPG